MEYPLKTYLTADTILSALGFSTEENLQAVGAFRSGLALIDDKSIYNQPFTGARIDPVRLKEKVEEQGIGDYTTLEQLFILAISDVIRRSGVDPAAGDCGLILSTTKGNIDRTGAETLPEAAFLSQMIERIGNYFGMKQTPMVLSTACISGVSALIVASRLIRNGDYKHIIVAGGDLLTRFVVTGFQSFKSVSPTICRPYDEMRDGLSLGEACAALLVTSDIQYVKETTPVLLAGGGISNDANHISGPSRTGDGLHLAISRALRESRLEAQEISFVNAHGTGTPYNDEMEAKAMHLSGLDHTPLNSLKPYWGHTLGASGLLETIACIDQLRRGIVYGTMGYVSTNVSYPLSVDSQHREVAMRHCLKTASGFGGSNAALVLSLAEQAKEIAQPEPIETTNIKSCIVRDGEIRVDGSLCFSADREDDFPQFIRKAYKHLIFDDRKFYKMDDLCKLGYIATAFLLEGKDIEKVYQPEEIGIILANRSASLDSDLKHQQEIDR
ncbi:beta-ACP synthase, partial [Parabacteroides sp. OttesenSCG-928-K15]|nr:beta-ACP synthase [Parabacteroides sp. OttesenSCG-928-K15]